jgi:LPXTG-motif cell wall-anchored protein
MKRGGLEMIKKLAPVLIAIVFGLVFLLSVSPATAAPDSVATFSGNDNNLAAEYPQYSWTKLDPAPAGTHIIDLGNGKAITIVVSTRQGHTYVASWSSNTPIYLISIKGGDGYNLYFYTGGATGDSDANLESPANNGGNIADISHIAIGYLTVTETQTPPVETQTPPVETQTPPAETQTPPVETQTPPVETQTPPAEPQTPPVETQTPPEETVNIPEDTPPVGPILTENPTEDPSETDTVIIPDETVPLGEASPAPTESEGVLPVTGEDDIMPAALIIGVPMAVAGILLIRKRRTARN